MAISSARDMELLRRTIELAEQSRACGNHPFGALLADRDGNIFMEAMNTCGAKGESRVRCARGRSTGQVSDEWCTA